DDGRVISSAEEDAVTLVAGDLFMNNSKVGAVSATNGRWLIASHTPVGGERGALDHEFRYYGVSYGDDWSLLPNGNGFLYRIAPEVTVSLGGTATKVYDGSDIADLTDATFDAID